MLKYITVTSLLFLSFFMNAQETEHKKLLETTWGAELFTFPINFARGIPLDGYEEAIFPKGWATEESPEFWSYIFAWNVTAEVPLTSSNFEAYLEMYFDGLMDIANIKNGDTILPTNALFIKSEEVENKSQYTGKIRLYEGRYTKKMMILNVLATQYFCETEKKTVVVFRFSPAEFEKPIWNTMNSIKLIDAECNF